VPAFFFLHLDGLIPSSSFFQQILVLTLGSPPEKGGKKNPGINPGQPAEKGRKKKPGINPGQPARKGREKKTLVLTLDRSPDLDFRPPDLDFRT
jgi:hypothetical protein